MGGQHKQPYGIGLVALPGRLDRHDVPEVARHLLLALGRTEQPVVHPVADERLLARDPLGLGDLVLVVGEDEVLASAVDVELLAEEGQRHRRALDVPPGAAPPPGTVPGRLPGLRRLPEDKIHRVLFSRIHVDAGAGLHLFERAAGEPAVIRKFRHPEKHIPVDGVGQAPIHEDLDHLQHLRHRGGRARVVVGPPDAEPIHLPEEAFGVFRRQRLHRDAPLPGGLDDPVFDIGEVLDERDAVAPIFQIPADHVEDQEGEGVADVGGAVEVRAADIHAHFAGVQGHELFRAPGEGIVDADRHHPALGTQDDRIRTTAAGRARPSTPP